MVPGKLPKRKRFHEATQRAIVRLLFLFGAAIPTCVLVAWICVRWTPWYQSYELASWNAWLSNQLGMQVTVAEVEAKSPNSLEFRSVLILHPESQQEVARVRLVEALRTSRGWALRLAQPEVQGPQLTACYRIIHDWFLCRPKTIQQTVVLAMNDLTIHGSTNQATLVDIQIDLENRQEQVASRMRFRLAGDPPLSQSRLDFTRSHRNKLSTWQLTTGDQALPCGLLSDYFRELQYLGELAQFSGTVAAKYGDDQPVETRLSGRLDRVQMDDLTQFIPFRVTGQAQLWLSDLSLMNGRIRTLKGSLMTNTHGRIDKQWVDGLARAMGSKPSSEESTTANAMRMLPYDAIAVDVELSTSGLVVRGLRDNPTLVQGPQGAWLTMPTPVASVSLVKAAELLSGQTATLDDSGTARHTTMNAMLAPYLPWPDPEGPKVSVIPSSSQQRDR